MGFGLGAVGFGKAQQSAGLEFGVVVALGGVERVLEGRGGRLGVLGGVLDLAHGQQQPGALEGCGFERADDAGQDAQGAFVGASVLEQGAELQGQAQGQVGVLCLQGPLECATKVGPRVDVWERAGGEPGGKMFGVAPGQGLGNVGSAQRLAIFGFEGAWGLQFLVCKGCRGRVQAVGLTAVALAGVFEQPLGVEAGQEIVDAVTRLEWAKVYDGARALHTEAARKGGALDQGHALARTQRRPHPAQRPRQRVGRVLGVARQLGGEARGRVAAGASGQHAQRQRHPTAVLNDVKEGAGLNLGKGLQRHIKLVGKKCQRGLGLERLGFQVRRRLGGQLQRL